MITIDSDQILVERFTNLLEVSASRIVIDHAAGRFVIDGSSLKVRLFCRDEIMIQGRIDSVRLVRHEKN